MYSNYLVFDYDHMKIGINGLIFPVETLDKENILGGVPLWIVIILMVIGMGILLGCISFFFIRYKYRRLQSELTVYDTLNQTVAS